MSTFWKSWSARRFELWLAAAVAINLAALAAGRVVHPPRPAVQWGLAFDVVVTVPGLYFLMVVRGATKGPRQTAWSLLPLCLLALFRGAWVAPGAAWARPWLGALAELALMVFLVARVRRGARAAAHGWDMLERLRVAAREVLPVAWAAEALASEFAIAWYAVCSWRARPEIPPGATAFTIHQRSGAGVLFAALAGLSAVEAVVAHVIAMRWSHRGAWILTVLSAYAVLWLAAVARSFALRPVCLADGALVLRSGIVCTLRVPLEQIVEVRRVGGQEGDLRMPPFSDANLRLVFGEPLVAVKMYGIRRTVRSVALSVDDPDGLWKAIRSA